MGTRVASCLRAPWFALVLSVLLVVGLFGCQRGKPAPMAPRGDTFAELRRVKGDVTVAPAGEKERAPYPRERLREGERVRLGADGLVWLRRDAGAVWLVAGPAQLTLESKAVELAQGRAFVDTEGGPPAEIRTPRGLLELSDARASVEVGAQGDVKVYVLRGSARADGQHRAGPGELLALMSEGKAEKTAELGWDDWTGGLATADPEAEPAPYGIGTVGARPPGDQGKPRFSLVVQRLDVRVRIDRDFAVTEVDETFVNPTPAVVEGIFSFRTPPGAVLSRFGVDRRGELVWGRIQESKSAAAQYQSNVYAGSTEDPALLTWAAPGVYKARFYPIEGGTPRRIVTRYSEWLPRQGPRGDRRLYVYPMAAEGARGSLPRIEELTVKIDLSGAGARRVLAGMGGKRDGNEVVIKEFDFVPRADLAIELFDDGQKDTIAYRAPHALGSDDGSKRDDFAKKVSGEEPDYLLVPLRAPASTETTPGAGIDLAIVVDTSAATESGALAVARTLSSALLSHLGPSDRAALWAGDASLRPVAEDSGTLVAVDREKRRAWLSGLAGVERGGATDLGALIAEAASRLDPKRRGAVIYIGDGQPSVGEIAPKALRERLARLPHGTRVLAAGLGSNANLALLQTVARGGPVEAVNDAYGAARTALRLLEAVAKPMWLGMSLDLGPNVERVLPRALPPLGSDEGILVVGRLKGPGPTELKLKGGDSNFTQRVRMVQLADGGDLRRRWGEQRLGELLDESAGRAALVDVGMRFGLVSPFTSIYVPTTRETEEAPRREPEVDVAQLQAEGRRRRAFWKPWSTKSHGLFTLSTAEAPLSYAPAFASSEESVGTRAKGEEASLDAAAKKEPAAASAAKQPEMLELAPAAPPAPEAQAKPESTSTSAEPSPVHETPTSAEVPMGATEPSLPAAGLGPLRGGGANGAGAIRPGAAGRGLTGLSATGRSSGTAVRVAGPKGNASIGSTNVSGGTVANAARVVAAMRAGFRNCFVRGLAEDPDSEGKIELDIRVGAGGEVARVTPTASGCLPASVIRCVMARAQVAQFDPPEGGGAVIAVPVTFVKDGGNGCGGKRAKGPPAEPEEAPKLDMTVVAKASVQTRLGVIGHTPLPCGRAADLPLEERRALWRERLLKVSAPDAAAAVYWGALRDCEARSWRERYALLIAMVDRLPTVSERVALWRTLHASSAAADAVYRAILVRVQTAEDLKELHQALGIKRAEPAIIAGVVARAKSPADRLSLLLETAAEWPDDLELALLVLEAFEDADDDGGGRAWARRLRHRADANAHVRTSVGEYYLRLSGRGKGATAERDANEARRTFGELVEFAPEDPIARRRLGDLLRAHGWYEEAFRQYETLAQLTPDDLGVPLLLAGAAQGMGRVEEAVRWIEKASQAGSPDGGSPLDRAARASASAFLAWAREAAVKAGRTEEAERLRARARRLTAGAAGQSGGVRFVVTWAHPELRPALWTSSLGALMPAPDNFPLFGAAEASLSESPAPVIELRLEAEDAARAARLGLRATVTALVAEGTPAERLTRLDVGFGRVGAVEERVKVTFENGVLLKVTP
jgi:tetratricopeptide (TPR) repeat protein